MKKLIYIFIALLSFTSCTTDDSVLTPPTETECPQTIYETLYIQYDSQDNVIKFNNNTENNWVQNQDFDQDFDSLFPSNPFIAFRHFDGWGHLTMQTTEKFVIVSVNLLNNPHDYSNANIFTNATNINTDRFTIDYDNGQDYADDGDVYYLTVTLAYVQ